MWCEHCRDHFEKDHYDQPYVGFDGEKYPDGQHGVGSEYGPYGILLEKEEKADMYDDLAKKYLQLQANFNRYHETLVFVSTSDNARACRNHAQEALFPSLRRWKENDE